MTIARRTYQAVREHRFSSIADVHGPAVKGKPVLTSSFTLGTCVSVLAGRHRTSLGQRNTCLRAFASLSFYDARPALLLWAGSMKLLSVPTADLELRTQGILNATAARITITSLSAPSD